MITQNILNRYNGTVQCAVKLDAPAGASKALKLGLAVLWAHKNRANLSRADLSGADLSGAYLSRADLRGADLSGADLSRADLSGADLSRAYLSGANLSRADLSRAYLSGAYLSRADLSRAYLSGADLSGADLSGADLSRADLSGADLSGAYLRGAYLRGAIVEGARKLIGTRPILQIGLLGSRCAYLLAYLTDQGICIRAGCFFGTLEEFRSAVSKTHGTNDHRREYMAAITMIEEFAKIWTPREE